MLMREMITQDAQVSGSLFMLQQAPISLTRARHWRASSVRCISPQVPENRGAAVTDATARPVANTVPLSKMAERCAAMGRDGQRCTKDVQRCKAHFLA